MTSKNWDSIVGPEPPSKDDFVLGGRKWHIRGRVPLLPLLSNQRNDENGQQVLPVQRIVECVIVPDEVPELLALLNDPATSPFDQEHLLDFGRWLMEVAGARPTTPPSGSEGGSETTGTTSRVRSSSRGTRPPR